MHDFVLYYWEKLMYTFRTHVSKILLFYDIFMQRYNLKHKNSQFIMKQGLLAVQTNQFSYIYFFIKLIHNLAENKLYAKPL
jgi:hypothetical protein